jgi:transcriptional regulator with XRE-family HTH domain
MEQNTQRLHPIARRCKELGISQNELARRLGVRPGTVSRYVTGKTILTSCDMRTINLMRVLNINFSYLKTY